MAYTSVGSFSWTEGGDSYAANFEVKGATSASNTFRLVTPLVRRIGKERMNPFNPIVPTRLETRLYDEGRVFWDYIQNNDTDEIAITVTKNSTTWHTGTLDRVEGGDQVRYKNPQLTLVWDNGLPPLKGKSFDEQGRVSLREGLWYLLEGTPDALNTRVALAWRHLASTGALYSEQTGLALEHMGQGSSYWDALSQVLRKLNLQVWQSGDKWLALQRSYRDGAYDWEQRNADGTESNGSTSPTVTLTDADLAGEQGGEDVKRDKIAPATWEESYTFEPIGWQNSDFTAQTTEAVSGATVPQGWYLDGSTAYDSTNDRVTLFASSSGYAGQVWDEVLVKTDSSQDQFDVSVSGEIEVIATGSTTTVDVPVLEVTAHYKDTKEYLDEGKSWSTSTQYIKASVSEYSGVGSTFRSFSISLTGTALSLSGPKDAEVYIRVRATTTSQDPDGDGDKEIGEVRWTSVDVGNLKRNVDRTRRPMGSATSKIEIGGRAQTEDTVIGGGWLSINTPANSNQTIENPAAGIRYRDPNSGDFLIAKKSQWSHATRSYSGYLENLRLLDRYAQHSRDLLRVRAHVKKGVIDFSSTVDWNGTTWVPTMIREVTGQEYQEVVLAELQDRDVSSAVVKVTNGSFSSASTDGTISAGGGGGGGGGGGTTYSDSDAVDALQAHDGTGVDADTLDGVEGSKYARTDVNETFNNDVYVSGGSVGIGTTSPSYALDVSGTAAADTVRVDGYAITKDSNGRLSISEPSGSEVLRLTSGGTLQAAGDVVAFGLSGGSGTGSSGGFSIAGEGLTSPDGETIEVDYGSGLTVNNGTLEADGSVGVSSVFGRSGDVTAQNGDYSHSQISGVSSDDHHSKYTDSNARSALQAGTDYIELNNQEMDSNFVGGQSGGLLGYDASVGLFLDYGGAGSGITKDVYPVLDVANTTTGSNVNVTYGGIDTRPKISLSQGSDSGLNADKLDGVEGSSYARTDVNETFNNDVYVSGGSVGIGTTSPSYALDVSGTGNFSGDLYASGSVGIGTTSPEVNGLHIEKGTAGSNPGLLRIQSSSGGSTEKGDTYAGIELGVDGGNTGATGEQPVTAYIKAKDDRSGSTSYEDGGLSFGTMDAGESYPQEQMFIDAAGSVGIGTASPDTKLHIKDGAAAIKIDDTDRAFPTIQFADSGAKEMTIQYRDDNDALAVRNAVGDFHLLIDRSSGNTGIQKEFPSYALDVSGTAAADTARVDGYEITKDGSGRLSISEPSGSEVLRLTSGGTLQAAGDVVAFGLSGGSGTGSSGGFSIAGEGLTSPDGETIEVDYGSGLTVNNGTLEADGSVGVSSVFGRSGDVTAQNGDYSHSQISGVSSDDHHSKYTDSEAVSAVESTRITSLRLANEDFSSNGNRGVIQFDKSAGLAYYNDATNAPGGDLSGTDATKWHRVLDTDVLNTGSELTLSRNGKEGQVGLSIDQGSGSGLNADKLDGYQGSDLAALSENETVTGAWTFKGLTSKVGRGSTHLFLDNDTDDTGMVFSVQANSMNLNAETAGTTTPTARFSINPSNHNSWVAAQGENFGVGTTSPSYALDVAGDINATGVGRFDITGDADTVDGYQGSDLAALSENETVTGAWTFKGLTSKVGRGSTHLFLDNDTDDTGMVFSVQANSMNLNAETAGTTTPTARFSINPSNHNSWVAAQGENFGIGTTSPSYALDVNGTGNFSGNLYASGNVGIGTTSPGKKLTVNTSSGDFTVQAFGGGSIKLASSNTLAHEVTSNSNMVFREAGTEHMRIENGGNVGIGTTSPSYALEVSGDARASGEVEAFLGSDRRLKTDLDPLGSALDRVQSLTGYGFDWRGTDAVQPHKRGETDVGLIAQEVESVLPEAVQTFADGHSEGYKSVNYDKVVPLLVEALKEQQDRINELESKITDQ